MENRITKAWKQPLAFAVAVISACVLSVSAGPGPMQVEEPALSGAQPPIQPEKEQASWKARKKAGLTPDQQAALKVRQQTMKDMMVLIQQKRRALQEARPEERQALAQELHNLIIEKGLVVDRPDRASGRKDGKHDGSLEKPTSEPGQGEKAARVQEDRPAAAAESKIRVREERRRNYDPWESRSWENKGNSKGNSSSED